MTVADGDQHAFNYNNGINHGNMNINVNGYHVPRAPHTVHHAMPHQGLPRHRGTVTLSDALHAAPSVAASEYDSLCRLKARLEDSNQPFSMLRKELLSIVASLIAMWEGAAAYRCHDVCKNFPSVVRMFLEYMVGPFCSNDPFAIPEFIFTHGVYIFHKDAFQDFSRDMSAVNQFLHQQYGLRKDIWQGTRGFTAMLKAAWELLYHIVVCDLRGDPVMVGKGLERMQVEENFPNENFRVFREMRGENPYYKLTNLNI